MTNRTNPQFAIVATCDPYNSRKHYHSGQVLEYSGASPIAWVMDTDDSRDVEIRTLKGFYAEENDIDEIAECNFAEGWYNYDSMSYAVMSAEEIREKYGVELRDPWDWEDDEEVEQ